MMVAFKALLKWPPGGLPRLTPSPSLPAKMVHLPYPSRAVLTSQCFFSHADPVHSISGPLISGFHAPTSHSSFIQEVFTGSWLISTIGWLWGNTRGKVGMIPPRWGQRLVQELADFLTKGRENESCRPNNVCPFSCWSGKAALTVCKQMEVDVFQWNWLPKTGTRLDLALRT